MTECLLQHESIKDVVILPIYRNGRPESLVAYYVSSKDCTTRMLRNYLRMKLPDYMIPSHFIKMEEIPLTKNGKIDVKALSKPTYHSINKIPPRNRKEEILIQIWQEVLSKKQIGIDDNFLYKFFSVWIAGIIVSIFASSGALVHFIIEGEYSLFYSWTIGMFFIPTLAIALGSLSGTRKLFEVIFILWWYVGPINGIPYLDFLGISSGYEGLYLILTLVLLAVGIISNQIKTGQFHVGSKKRVYQRNIQKESINEKFK